MLLVCNYCKMNVGATAEIVLFSHVPNIDIAIKCAFCKIEDVDGMMEIDRALDLYNEKKRVPINS